MTARTRCGWVYKSYVRPAILYGNETWHLIACEMGILRWTERSMARAMCGVQLKDVKSEILMVMFGLNETMDQLDMANHVC